MEFKDGVMYATPNGHLFNKGDLERFAESAGKVIGTFVDSIYLAFEQLKSFVSKAVKSITKFLEEADIKKIQERIENEKRMRRSWDAPMNMTKRSQVINRKPSFIHARNRL